MERFLKNQELHEFAQWFAFNYGGGIGGRKEQNKFPREDIIDLVDTFIKSKIANGDTNIGFIKWFAEKYEIYGDCKGRGYQKFSESTNWDTSIHYAKTNQEWIDQHFDGGNADGLLYSYFQDKIKGNIFQILSLEDLKKQLDADGIRMVDEKGKSFDISNGDNVGTQE
jgi:hypothetical protein